MKLDSNGWKCPICGNNRQSKAHKEQRERCERLVKEMYLHKRK